MRMQNEEGHTFHNCVDHEMKSNDRLDAKLKRKAGIAVVICLLAAAFSLHWEFGIGSARVYWSGLSYLPSYYTGPYDQWIVINESLGPCSGFDSSRSVGFIAGKWQVRLEILRGWRQLSSNQ